MFPKAAEVRLTPEDRLAFEARVRAPTTEQRDVLRARIVLLADEGRSARAIAKAVDVMSRTVSLWRAAIPGKAWPGLPRSRGQGLLQNTTPSRPGGLLQFWIVRRRPGSPAGRAR